MVMNILRVARDPSSSREEWLSFLLAPFLPQGFPCRMEELALPCSRGSKGPREQGATGPPPQVPQSWIPTPATLEASFLVSLHDSFAKTVRLMCVFTQQ